MDNLDEVHEGLLLQAVKASWLAKKNQARIDDVVNFLKNASDSEQYAESPTIRSRLDEMIVLLDQYTANGTYGRYFNSDEPSLRDDARMVVLELGGLEDRPSLLVAVMFSLIIYIENRMYRTPRNLKKLNVIDEGWRLLDFKNHKVGEFIEKGYRTARRHTGAYITITQNIVDFDSDKASSAARAAWGNSSYKIILKQSAKEFAKYNQLYLTLPTLDEAVNTLKPWWPGLFDGDTPRLLACGIRDVLLEDVSKRNIPLSHKKLRRALKAITRSESYLCAMKAGACRYDTQGYVTEHISQEEEAYAAERLAKIRRQNRRKAELRAVLDEQ